MALWTTASDKDDKSKGGIWFDNRYKGSDAGAEADIKGFDTFKTQFGMMQKRMGEISGEFDRREQFLDQANVIEKGQIGRSAMMGLSAGEDKIGQTGFAFSGGATKVQENTRSGFVDQLKGNAMDFAKSRFELGLQEKAETFGMQTNMLDLYANYQANRQNLEFDATDDFDVNKEAGIV
jgi:hypothetical protein